MSISKITNLIQLGEYEEADDLCDQLRFYEPDNIDYKLLQKEIHEHLTHDRLPGPQYTEWLSWLHRLIDPARYLEIGVESGRSLALASPRTRVVGIDPAPHIIHGFEAPTSIFRMESDSFFEKHNAKSILGGTVDLSFIDGLHHYDCALRDFLNVEKASHNGTVILLHDIYPVVPSTATRDWNTFYWAGDTWKMMHILAKYRPDLDIYTIPTYPSGLGLITNLNPDAAPFDVAAAVEEFKDSVYTLNTRPVNLIDNDFDTVASILML